MKNSKITIAISLILVLCGTLLLAESGYNISCSQPTNDEINLDFNLVNYNVEQTTQNGVTYSKINFENSRHRFEFFVFYYKSRIIDIRRNNPGKRMGSKRKI